MNRWAGLKVVCRRLADAVVARMARGLRAIPAVRRALRLPRRRIRAPGVWVAAEQAPLDWMERGKAPRYDVLYPPVTVVRPVPASPLGEAIPRVLSREGFHAHAEVFLARLPGARLLGPHGTVITAAGDVVEESAWDGGWLERGRALRALRLPTPMRLDGEYYTIASVWQTESLDLLRFGTVPRVTLGD
jgi:hypothetical protein